MTVRTTIDEKLLFELTEEAHLVKGGDLTIAELLWILKTPCPDFLVSRSPDEVIGTKIEGTERTLLFNTPVNISEDEELERDGQIFAIQILARQETYPKFTVVKASVRIPEPIGIHFLDPNIRRWYLKQREARSNLIVYRIQPDDHVRARHAELRAAVQKCHIIYIDTCHWIKMRHCILNASKKSEVYGHILDSLRRLKQDGIILCPVSLPLFAELTRQKDAITRQATAKLMDELSDGVCLQSPDALLEMETQRCVAEILLGDNAPDLLEWAWTKVGWLGGEDLEAANNLTPEQVGYLQTTFFDFVWQMTFEDVLKTMKDMPLPVIDERVRAALWYNAEAASVAKTGRKFDAVLKIQRRNVFLQSNFKERFCNAVDRLAKRFPKEAGLAHERMKPLEKVDPFMISTLQIVSAIQAAFISSRQKFKPNDINDAQHAAIALPYCDVFFCDNPLAQKLNAPPLRFDIAYSTAIMGDPASFLQYLMQLETKAKKEPKTG